MSGAQKTDLQAQRLIDAQAAVLGSMLIDGDCIADVLAEVNEKMFISGAYRTIYGAIRELFQAARPVDIVTVGAQLRETSGTSDYDKVLVQLAEVTPTAANVMAYVDVLRRDSIVYRLREIGRALTETEDLETCEELVSKANAAMSAKSGVEIWGPREIWDSFVRRHDGARPIEYIDWGFAFINENVYTGRGDYCVLGGYSTAGKTCLAIAMALRMSQKYRVGFFSYETDKDKLSDRILCARAMVDSGAIKRNELDEKAWQELAYAASKLDEGGEAHRIEIMQTSGFTVSDIQSLAMSRHYDVIFIDYIQLVEPDGRRSFSRPEEVGAISRGLQRMAHEQGITVVALSQLTPESSGKKNEAPTMYSLRESKQITQDADVIFLLYLEDAEDRNARRVFKCDKNKDGVAGWYKKMTFRGNIQTFEPEAAPVSTWKQPLPDQVSFKEIEDDGTMPF